MVLGLNLRRKRVAADLSQEDLADLSGIGRSHVGAIERGEQNVTVVLIEKIAGALKCEPMELLDRDKARAFGRIGAANKRPRRRRPRN